MNLDYYLQEAIKEAKKGYEEGGIPIGAVIVYKDKIVGRGHNKRVQLGSAVLHAEMDAIENMGRHPAKTYNECTLYTTLSPCSMCSGAIILYKIPFVVIGENETFKGEEDFLKGRGVQIEVVNNIECIEIMKKFISEKPELWNEDIGI